MDRTDDDQKVSEWDSSMGFFNGVFNGILQWGFQWREFMKREGIWDLMLATSHEGTGVNLHNHSRVHFRYLSLSRVNEWQGYRGSTDKAVEYMSSVTKIVMEEDARRREESQ